MEDSSLRQSRPIVHASEVIARTLAQIVLRDTVHVAILKEEQAMEAVVLQPAQLAAEGVKSGIRNAMADGNQEAPVRRAQAQ